MRDSQNTKDPEFWRARVIEAANYPGTDTAFCRSQGLCNSSFKNWKYRFARESKNSLPALRDYPRQKAFIPVQVPKMTDKVRRLPDPEWMGELIFHLMRVGQ